MRMSLRFAGQSLVNLDRPLNSGKYTIDIADNVVNYCFNADCITHTFAPGTTIVTAEQMGTPLDIVTGLNTLGSFNDATIANLIVDSL